MARGGVRIGGLAATALVLGVVVAGCNAPPRTPEETRMYPKDPLEVMGPLIKPEPTTAMSRLARLNKPAVVEIPAESVLAPPRK